MLIKATLLAQFIEYSRKKCQPLPWKKRISLVALLGKATAIPATALLQNTCSIAVSLSLAARFSH
jgi:hypothetical protein